MNSKDFDWSKSYEYQRILEVLCDYWLTEPEEESVVVELHFYHKDGQEQHKRIRWNNPNISRTERRDLENWPAFLTAAEILQHYSETEK